MDKAVQALRDLVRTKLATGTPKAVIPLPPPRYDDVFEEGTSWLDQQAVASPMLGAGPYIDLAVMPIVPSPSTKGHD